MTISSATRADTIIVTQNDDHSEGVNFSWIHSATEMKQVEAAASFYKSGWVLSQIAAVAPFELNGAVDLANRTLTVTPTTLSLDVQNSSGSFNQDGSITLWTDSALNFHNGAGSQGAYLGKLSYTISGSSRFADDVGAFHFYYYNFSGSALDQGPNNMFVSGNTADVQLWGNNWASGDPAVNPLVLDSSAKQRLGIDLRLAVTDTTSLPDSGNPLLLLGSMTIGLGILSRFRPGLV